MPTAARYFFKVYNQTGTVYRRTIAADKVLSLPKIIREIGKPAAELTLAIELPWDDFGYGDTLNLFDLIKIYAINDTYPQGALIFQGHVTEFNIERRAGINRVALRILPIDSLLNMAFFKTGAGAYSVPYSNADVDTIFSDAITRANGIFGSFFTAELADPGASVTVTFESKTHLAAMQESIDLLGDSYYFRVEADGTVRLAEYNDATADHTLTMDKEIDGLKIINSIMETKNGIRLAWGDTPDYSYYEDTDSKTAYGVREEAVSASEIKNAGTANARGAADIARKKNPKISLQITVNAEYDIMAILPGDTLQIRNVPASIASMLGGVMRIKRVECDGAVALLHIADIVDNFGAELSKAIQ
jgi:hypothetical protein